jgi:translation initiation factor IF-3
MRSIVRFFEEGDKVKVTLRFRGREMAHQDLGFRLLERVKSETLSIAKVEAESGSVPEVRYFLDFVKSSKRGVAR